MHLQENTEFFFDLDLGVTRNAVQYPLHLQRLKLERRCIYKKIQYLTFDLGSKFTQDFAQYPLHCVTYAAAKFEVAFSNGL